MKFWKFEVLKVISAGISCVWNITKGYVKNMAYIWSGAGGRGGGGLVCWYLQLMLSGGGGGGGGYYME